MTRGTTHHSSKSEENGGTFMVGELVCLEDELNPVIKTLEHFKTLGVDVTAEHNHLTFEHPHLLYVHFTGFGDARTQAQIVVAALVKTRAPRTNDDNQQDKDDTVSGFDVSKVESILGGTATIVDHVLEITKDCSAHLTNEGRDFYGTLKKKYAGCCHPALPALTLPQVIA